MGLDSQHSINYVWCYQPLLQLRRWRQKDLEFKVILSCLGPNEYLRLNIKNKKKKGYRAINIKQLDFSFLLTEIP